MPGTTRTISAETGDYVDAGDGQWEETTTMEVKIRHQILTWKNKWIGDPDSGSNVLRFQRAKNSRTEMLRLSNEIKSALKPFIDAGEIKDLTIEITRDVRTGWGVLVSCVDAQHARIDLTPMLAFQG